MRLSSRIALSLAALGLVAACSEEPKAVAKQRVKPAHVSKSRPASTGVTEQRAEVLESGNEDSGVVARVAQPEREEERTLLEEEALFHDELETSWLAEGKRLMDEGKPGEAVTAFRRALFDMQDPDTWSALGYGYVASGQTERGIACLEEALRKDPSHVVAREKLTRAYLTTDGGKARAHAEVLARTQPDDAAAHYTLGRAYMKLRMWSEAIGSFERSLSLDPTSSYAHNNLGYSALQVGQTELALEHLEAILDLSPKAPYMLNNLGLAYEKVGRGPDAYAAYLRALEMKPGYVNAAVNRDRVKVRLSDDEKAVALDILQELKAESVAGATTAAVGSDEHGAP